MNRALSQLCAAVTEVSAHYTAKTHCASILDGNALLAPQNEACDCVGYVGNHEAARKRERASQSNVVDLEHFATHFNLGDK